MRGRGSPAPRPRSPRVIVMVVVEGSAMPRVLGVRSPGSGALAIIQQLAVLPEAERGDDRKGRDRDDEPRAELVEVLDEGQAVLEAHWPLPGPSTRPWAR